MELETLYAGEPISFTLDLDTSSTVGDYALTADPTFRIGTAGSPALGVLAASKPSDDSGLVTVAGTVPSLPSGDYAWQLLSAEGMLLTEGVVAIASIIAAPDPEATAPSVTITVGTDTYLTVADADALLQKRLGVDEWRAANADDKARALCMATAAIDNLMLVGMPIVASQKLAFPRAIHITSGTRLPYHQYPASLAGFGADWVVQEAVPSDVLLACALEADAQLGGADSERLRLQAQGVKSIGIGSLSETYTGSNRGLLSPDAQNLMRDYIAGRVATR